VGNELRLGNDLLSTVKMGLGWDLESMGWRGDFVNCALLDLFFVSFARGTNFHIKIASSFLFNVLWTGLHVVRCVVTTI